MLALGPGCLASDPPTYGRSEQTPPFLDMTQVNPDIYKVLVVSSQGQVPINVPFQSEDAGESIKAVLILDYDPTVPAGGNLQYVGDVAPGTFDEVRKVSLSWVVPDIPSSDNCHQLALLVDHASAFDDNTNRPKVSSKPAVVTWWVNIDGAAPTDLTGCKNSRRRREARPRFRLRRAVRQRLQRRLAGSKRLHADQERVQDQRRLRRWHLRSEPQRLRRLPGPVLHRDVRDHAAVQLGGVFQRALFANARGSLHRRWRLRPAASQRGHGDRAGGAHACQPPARGLRLVLRRQQHGAGEDHLHTHRAAPGAVLRELLRVHGESAGLRLRAEDPARDLRRVRGAGPRANQLHLLQCRPAADQGSGHPGSGVHPAAGGAAGELAQGGGLLAQAPAPGRTRVGKQSGRPRRLEHRRHRSHVGPRALFARHALAHLER